MAEGYRQLALAERKEIEMGLTRGDSFREIARNRQQPVDRLAAGPREQERARVQAAEDGVPRQELV